MSHIRWMVVLSLFLIGQAWAQDVPATQPEPLTPTVPIDTAALDAMDRDTLKVLCVNLYQRIAQLEQRLRDADLDELQIKIRALELENGELRSKLASLQRDHQALQVQLAKQKSQQPQVGPPSWAYEWQMSFIKLVNGQTTLIVSSDGDAAVIQSLDEYDRQRVVVEGSFLNRSTSPYRYGFDIAVGYKARAGVLVAAHPTIVGRRAYQTPVLQPGELHSFRVEIPVDDIAYAQICDIGHVTPFPVTPAVGPQPDVATPNH